MDSAKVGPKVRPIISTWSWKSIHSTVTCSVNSPTASAFDFVGLRRASVACSKHRIAWCILAKTAGWEKKAVTSFAYARTGKNCLDLPICNPGRVSSSELMMGCRQSAYRSMLKGQPFLIPLWIDMGPAKTPLICTEVICPVVQGVHSVCEPLKYSLPPQSVKQVLMGNTVKGVILIKCWDSQRGSHYLGMGEDTVDTGNCVQDWVPRNSTKLTLLELIEENVSKATGHNSSR